MRHEAGILASLREGERVVDLFEYFEKSEHSLMVLEYLQVNKSLTLKKKNMMRTKEWC